MSSTEKNRTKRSYDFTPCLPFWDALTSSQQQMLRLNTIVRSYRAGDNVVFSMPERNGLFLVLSGGLRVFIATDTGREITLLSVVSGGCCVLNTLDSAEPGDTMPILQASSDAVFAYINIVALRPLCAEAPVVEQFLRSVPRAMYRRCSITLSIISSTRCAAASRASCLKKPMHTQRTASRASSPRGDLAPPRHDQRGHQQRA